MPLIHRLPSSTVKLISSSQVITSVSSVVKELLENAIDAGAGNIEIKLDNNGQDGIEVRDNGSGIKKADVPSMCQSSCTSKIQDFDDLEQLESYGFRGEALNAICRVSDVCITTRTSEDDLAMVYVMDHSGNIVSSKPSALGTGTTVTVTRLFHNLPVRKQYLNSGKRAKEELKKTESIVKFLALINPSLRVTLCHNKCLIWQKPSVTKLRDSLMQVIGHALVNKLQELSYNKDKVNITLVVPKKDCDSLDSLCQSHIECMMIYVNKRPVRYRKLEKVILRCISVKFDGQLTARKYPTCLVSVLIAPSELDVNLEPNKTKVLFKEEDEVFQIIENMLVIYYGIKLDAPKAVEASENNLDSTDGDLDTSISEQENESLKVKSKPRVTTVQNNVFKRPEIQAPCELEGEIACKRLKLNVAGEAASENTAKNNDSSEINRKYDSDAHVPAISALANNSFLEGIRNPSGKPDSYDLHRNLNGQEGACRQNVENLYRLKDGDHSVEIPSVLALGSASRGISSLGDSVVDKVDNMESNLEDLNAPKFGSKRLEVTCLGSLMSGRSPVNDSVVERVMNVRMLKDVNKSSETSLPASESIGNDTDSVVVNRAVDFQKLSGDGDTSVGLTSLSALERSPINDSVVERVVNTGINLQNVSNLRNGAKPIETPSLSVSENVNFSKPPVSDNGAGNVANRAVNLQRLSISQDGDTTLELPSLSVLGSLSSGRSAISDSVVNKVVNRAVNLQNLRDGNETLACSTLENTSGGEVPFGDRENMMKTTELQDTLTSSDNHNVLDITQFVGGIKENEIHELLTLSDVEIAKELDTEFHTDKDETSLISAIGAEQERNSKQGTEPEMCNESLLSRQMDRTGNNRLSSAVEHGDVNSVLKAQETGAPLGKNPSQSWTRGILKGPNGNIIQGAAVLSKSRGDIPVKTLDASLQRVSGQMEKKEHNAFVKFSREERAQVLKENPGIVFTKIPGVLLERWKALPPEEKAHYYETEKPKSNGLVSPGQHDIRKMCSKTGGQNETLKPKERWKIGNRKQQEVAVSLEKLLEPCEVTLSQTEPPEVLIIGYANPDGPWVYRKNKELGVMRHWGLKETVVYHRLMAEHTVPLQKLDKPILVDDSTVGADNMELLLSLRRNYDVETHAVIVTSDVIRKNGFRVEIKEGLEQTYCLLTDVASTINFYGLNDLKDTLDLLRQSGIGPLEKCRNLRVSGYIKGQAVRMIHQSPNMLDKQAVQELVNYWSANASVLGNECLHRKPFFEKLHDLSG